MENSEKKISLNQNERYLMSIDWLQLYLLGEMTSTTFFKYRDKKRNTRVFRYWYEVIYCDEVVFDVFFSPFSSVIKKNAIQLKVRNNILYRPNLFAIIDKFIMDNNLVLKSISRLDLCVDFQYFENNYHPRDLIADLLSSKILYNCNSDFSLHGHTRNVAQFDSMSFGSRASNYYVTMYNKSQEMRSVKTKNYIQQLWKDNDFDMERDTWRVEIAINNSNSCLVDSETGEAFVLNYNNLKDNEILKNYFQLLISHKFAFKINSNQKNKSRMADVKLFNFPNFIIRSFLLCYKRDTNHSNKVFVTSLVNYIISLPPHHQYVINEYKCLLLHYITDHNLFRYYKKRFSSELPLSTLNYKQKVIYAAPDSYANDFLETCFLA